MNFCSYVQKVSQDVTFYRFYVSILFLFVVNLTICWIEVLIPVTTSRKSGSAAFLRLKPLDSRHKAANRGEMEAN